MKKVIVFLSVLAIFGMLGAANADTISYTVEGWTDQFPAETTPPEDAPWGPDGYPGDTVEFQEYTGTLELTPGTYTQQINTLLWTIDYTYGGTADDPDARSDLSFDFTAPRTISFAGGPSGTLSQDGLLEATWFNDYLSLYDGDAITLIVLGYQVEITPLVLPEAGGSNFSGDNPWVQPSRDVMAQFTVTEAPVPIPSAVILLGSGFIGFIGLRRRIFGRTE